MNILICPDSFKDSLNSIEICEVLFNALKESDLCVELVTIPLADGGEGTLDVLYHVGNFERVDMTSLDPLARSISTTYLWDSKTETVVIELAQASGIERLAWDERNCMQTTTYGTGLQIKHAIEKCRPSKIYLTVGGSATNDAGLGMLAALGCDIIGSQGSTIGVPVGADLINLSNIVATEDFKGLIDGIGFTVVNDVDNPFSGIKGAAHIYAKQKGASPEEIVILEKGLKVTRDIIINNFEINLDEVSGAGAAGGIAGGAYAYLDAMMIPGTSFVSDIIDLENVLANADLVITGEGRLDAQTLHGKLVRHVSNLCKIHEKKLIVICGANDMNDVELAQLGNPLVYALNEYNAGEYNNETTKRDLSRAMKDICQSL